MPDQATQELIDGLNEDLAAEFQAMIHYLVGAEMMTGPNRPELKNFFEAEIQDELGHAQFLTAKIRTLGGEPTTEPADVELGASNREQLEIALRAEKETIERYKQRVKQAEAAGETGLTVRLEDVIADEEEHRDEIRMVLENY